MRKLSLLRAVLAVGSLAFVWPAAANAEQPHLLSYAKSSSMTSNTTNVINGVPQPGTLLLLNGQPFTVRSVPLGQVGAGETIKALSEVEVTNDVVTKDGAGTNRFHDVGAALTLIIADSPTATTGIEVAEAQGNYVTPQMHHWTFEKSGSYTPAQDQSGKYLNLVMWAYSAAPISNCWTFPRSSQPNPQQPRACGMDVDFNRGHLSVLRTGPAATLPADATPFSVEQFSGRSLPEASPSDAPIIYGNEPAQLIVGMSRPVGALQTNDVLTAHTELQVDARNTVRSNASCNVQVATRLYLSPSPNSLTGARAIGAEAGYNFTGQEQRQIRTLERGVVPSSTTFELDQAYSAPRYVVLRVWTKGNSACALFGNGIRVQFDQPASFMHVMRYRPEAQANLVVETTNSGDGSEQVSRLNTLTGAPATVYSRELTELAPGDLVEALGEVEVNTSHHRAEVHTSPVLAGSPTATTGVPLQVDNFTEVSPYMASLPMHDATGWVVPAGTGSHQYLNMVIRAPRLGTLGTAPDDFIGVGPDDGRLLVQQFRRPRTAAPEITDTDPNSPANENNPEVKGSTEAGTTVKLYQSADCTGAIEAQGTAAAFASPGLTATVANDSPATFTATATDAPGNVSPCSSPFTYTEDSTPPAAPGSLAASPASPANDNGPEVRGAAETGSTVRVYKAATSSDCTAANLAATGAAAGFSSPGLTASVFDNTTTTFRATATDAAGNTSACSSSSLAYTEDSTPPAAPSSLATSPGTPANDNNPEVRGSAETGSTVRVYKAATSSDCTAANLAATGAAAGFSSPGLTASVFDNTTTTFRATATDAAGNTSACSSSSLAYTEDSTPPAAPSSLATSPGTPANDNNPEVRGSAETGSTVRVYKAATSSDCTAANLAATGAAAGFSSPGLTASVFDNTTTTFRTTATDAAGNVSACSSSAITYEEDSIAPSSPTSLAVAPTPPANHNSPQVSGTADADSTVKLYTNANCTSVVAATGSAAGFSSPGLSAPVSDDTTTTFRATATDAAGNISPCSASSVSYQEDSTPPSAPSSLVVSPASPANHNNPQLSGTAEAGSTVKLYKAPTTSDCTDGNLAATGAAGDFSSTGLTASVSDDTTTTFRATATDAAGNLSACSGGSASYQEDSSPPAEPILTGTDPNSPANDNSPEVKGTAEGSSTVKLYKAPTTSDCTGENLAATGAAAGFSSPGLTPSVSDNTTTIFRATATDAAGNTSSCSSSTTSYAEDSTIPEAPILTGTDPHSPANDNTPEVKGSAQASSTVRIYEAATSSDCTAGNLVATGSAAGFSSPGLSVPVSDDTTTTFRATASNAAGNASPCSGPYGFTEDSSSPETTIYNGPSRRTRKHRARFSFGAGEPATVRCKLDRRAVERCSSPAVYRNLKLGRHLFRVWATDRAGNVETDPAVLKFRVLRPARRRP